MIDVRVTALTRDSNITKSWNHQNSAHVARPENTAQRRRQLPTASKNPIATPRSGRPEVHILQH